MSDPGRLTLVLLTVAAYLLGAVNPAALMAWSRGVDLHAFGSGNPGATNVARALGRRWGVFVGVLDVAKGAVPAAVALSVVGRPEAYAVAAAAVLGHVTSPFLRGRGGKGVATSLGVLLGLAWLWVGAVAVVFLVVVTLTRWVAGASVAAALALLPVCLLLPPVLNGEADRWSRLFGVFLVLVVLGRHRTNLLLRWMTRKARLRA